MEEWTPRPLELNENERRAIHFSIALRISSARARNETKPPKRRKDRQQRSALLGIEESFNATLENPLGRDERKAFSFDDDGITAAVEALSFAIKTIEKSASIRGFTPFLTGLGLDACKDARFACLQSVPLSLHQDLGLELIEGAVFFQANH